MKYVIGVDLGTSGVKCLLLSEEGKIADIKTASYTPDFGAKGHVEQNPAVWWENTKLCISELMAANRQVKDDVVALSCSGQMHSSVFLDEAGNVIRPAILWNDTRTTKQTKDIYQAAGGKENVLAQVYNLALEGFTLPKILWLKENESENYSRVSKVIMPKDYINYMLTSRIATDYSDAAGTLMFDVKNRCFNKEFVETTGISPDILPEAMESTGVVGVIKAELADELGLNANVRIIAGGADNSCAAIGNGIVKEGDAVISVGTSGTVVAFLKDIRGEVNGAVHLFNYSYPDSLYAMGCMLSAGESLSWLRKNILAGMDFNELNKLAEQTHIGSNGLIFLPYLFGERCPHTDANARGVFFGLSAQTGRAEMARAVMEGVAFGLNDMFNMVTQFADMDEIYLTGGGAKSEVWGGIICNIINRKLKVLNVEEGPAFGAALIAAVGSGMYEDFQTAKSATMKIVKEFTPDIEKAREYEAYYSIFKKLYPAVKDLYSDLADVQK